MKRYLLPIRLYFSLLFLFLCFSVSAQRDTLSFLHVTDLHVIFDINLYQEDLAIDRKGRDEQANLFKHFLTAVPNKTNADFVIATGDLLDSYEQKGKDNSMLDSSINQFASIINDNKLPIYLTLGNHDLNSFTWVNGKRMVKQLNAEKSRATWIRNLDCFKYGTYYSQVHKVGKTTYRFIYLDNSYVKFPKEKNITIPYIDTSQLLWLKGQLDESEDDIEVVFMHLPFELIDERPESSELYSLLTQSESTKLIVAGHQHKGKIVSLPTKSKNDLKQIQTAALMRKKDNWRLITLTENRIVISLQGTTDNELIIPVD